MESITLALLTVSYVSLHEKLDSTCVVIVLPEPTEAVRI